MASRNKFWGLVAAASLALWFGDAVLDSFVFGARTFPESALFAIPAHDVLGRCTSILILVLAAAAGSRIARARERLAEELVASRGRFRSLIEDAPLAYQSLGESGRLVDVNPAWERTFGHDRQAVVGTRFADLIPDEAQRARFAEWFRACLAGGEGGGLEVELRRPGGGTTVGALWGRGSHSEGGAPTHVHCLVTDVTVRRRTDGALREILRAPATDAGFLRAAVRGLAQAFDVRYGFVSTFLGDGRLRTLAFWAGDDFGDDFEYALEGSPCGQVTATASECHYPDHVAEQFPRDAVLGALGIESYFGVPLHDSSGEATGILAVLDVRPMEPAPELRDLLRLVAARAAAEIERRRFVEEIERSRQFLRTVLDAIPEPTLVVSPDYRVLLADPATLARMGGVGSDDGVRCYEISHGRREPCDGAGWPCPLREVIETRAPVSTRHVHAGSDGEEEIVEITAAPILAPDGSVTAVVESHRVVTERVRAKIELEESERRFRATFEQAALGVVNCTLDGRFVRVNGRFCELVGYGPEEIPGLRFQDITHPDDLEADLHLVERLVAGEIDRFAMEKRYVRKDGGVVHARITVSLMRGTDGRPEHLIGVVEDVTERRSLEQQLRRAQKMEAVALLAGGIAHDFRNQLTVIAGNAELMGAELAPGDPLEAYVKDIEQSADRARLVTEQLLAFGRRQTLRPEILDVGRAATAIRKAMARIIGEQIELTVTNRGSDVYAEVDRSSFDQAVTNLVLNARDAMPEGGRLSLETDVCAVGAAQARAIASGMAPGDWVRLSVRDTGQGMPPAVVDRIFEPFFTTKEQGKGTGLGLAMVHGFVTQSHGYVTVESALGGGTTVSLYFPHAARGPSADAATAVVRDDLAGRETVLLVEDDENVRHVIARGLRAYGYTVLEAGNAREGVPLGTHYEGDIHVLVTDIVMPGMRGPVLAAALRRSRPGLRVLLMSGYAEEIPTSLAALQAAVEFVPKPVTPSQIARAIRSLLRD